MPLDSLVLREYFRFIVASCAQRRARSRFSSWETESIMSGNVRLTLLETVPVTSERCTELVKLFVSESVFSAADGPANSKPSKGCQRCVELIVSRSVSELRCAKGFLGDSESRSHSLERAS